MEQELAIKLRDDRINHLTQVEIPVTTADLYFPLELRPLLVFIDGRSILEQLKWRRTKNYDLYYAGEDTESWSYTTTATRTRKETNCTTKSWTA